MNDIKRPKQKVKRQIKRSNIALDEYMFDRKMKSLYYGAKPTSDDTPNAIKWLKNIPSSLKKLASRLKISAKKHPLRSLAAALMGLVVVLFAAVQIAHSIAGRSDGSTSLKGKDGKTAASQPVVASRIPLNQTPEFPVELPQGKTAADLGGWAKVNPPNAPTTYAYKDTIGTVDILVSEQLLPDTFKSDTSKQVEKLAVGFNATQSVKTEKNEFFIGSNSDGEQSVITYSKTLLIFLKSSAKISNERWTTYIQDLK